MTGRTWGGALAALMALAVSTQVANASASRSRSIDERVAAQRAIEEVYWRHRMWPKDNAAPRPSLDALMPRSLMRAKVEDYLKKSNALETWWHRPISGDQLQAELNRMARGSRDSRMLQELFEALGNDPFVIAETLARPSLVDRLARNWYVSDDRFNGSRPAFEAWWKLERARQSTDVARTTGTFSLPALDPAGCVNDTWTPTLTEVPDHRLLHTTVWTGTEMIVWGGYSSGYELNTGGRYNPATDTWTPTSTGANVPLATYRHTAVWTGTEMIVWGGSHTDQTTGSFVRLNSGARYDPANDSWTPTSTGVNVPTGRQEHLAVWTGTEMIVWGGWGNPDPLSGGRYHPGTNSWTTISAGANAPIAHSAHKAVWTGTEMIVWASPGGRYNPVTDSWSPMSTSASVPFHSFYTAVWTGTEMIVWGGFDSGPYLWFNTGGRYNPSTDSWTATSTGANVPSPRAAHTAVWTGSKMIVWGGQGPGFLNDGATYDPSNDSWVATASTTLEPRWGHTAIWTGTELIVWGGLGNESFYQSGLNSGGRYNPASDSWVATSMGAAAPIGRLAHTAIWTGTEMIVWGGQAQASPPNGELSLSSGGRYPPATDSWLPTSIGSQVPSARTYHSAVWTGTEMIVWGGLGLGQNWLNTGGRYNPTTDTWSATSTDVNVPPALHGAQNVWTGHEMIVWGMDGSTATGGLYDPTTDSWRAMATGTTATEPFFSPIVWTGQEMIVWGDGPEPGSRYNPSTDSWATISTGANAPFLRPGYANVWTGSEMIAWGGANSTTGGRYNPSTDSWIPTSAGANVPSSRTLATAVWTGSEMLVWGGGNVSSNNPATVGGRYNPTTNGWLPMSIRPNAPSPVPSFHTAVWTGTEMIVWGGFPGTGTGGRYCACPSGRLVYRDADGDGYGDPGVSSASCDGSAPAGYVVDFSDCNDASAAAHPTAGEACNGSDDDCDGLVDESVTGEDSDGDSIHDACDNCRFVAYATQSDFNNDGEGDACDLNDGLIYEWRVDKTSVSWQAEAGPTSWNVYIGDFAVLKATGVYTQLPGSNALADRHCGEIATLVSETSVPAAGKASFSLVTGVTSGVEGSLGSATSGGRANANPCP